MSLTTKPQLSLIGSLVYSQLMEWLHRLNDNYTCHRNDLKCKGDKAHFQKQVWTHLNILQCLRGWSYWFALECHTNMSPLDKRYLLREQWGHLVSFLSNRSILLLKRVSHYHLQIMSNLHRFYLMKSFKLQLKRVNSH